MTEAKYFIKITKLKIKIFINGNNKTVEIIKQYLDITVFGILGIMAFIVLWMTIERLIFFSKVNISHYTHIELLQVDLTKNLTSISIIGANAPYIGLVGTVVGILIIFYDMGQQDAFDTSTIMVGLALALQVTAAGIGLAIPSIMSYNGLMRKVDVLSAQFIAITSPLKKD